MKLGKLPATYSAKDLQFNSYRLSPLPNHPRSFGHEKLVTNWQMLGNDQFGDCVWAGAAHETVVWNAEAHKAVMFSDQSVLSDYSAVTGFNADDPNSDQGTSVRDALNYRVKTGIVDAVGTRHKLGAFVALEPGNWDHLLEAVYLFGAVGVGIQFPNSAMDQFNSGRAWSVVAGSAVEGGHYIPLVAYRSSLVCVTWGRTQHMTKRFYEKYCDEAYALLSPETLVAGKTIDGFDFLTLEHDLSLL